MIPFPARALDLPHQTASGGTRASRSLRKRLTLRFPPLTEESRFSRNGVYEIFLTPWGEVVVVLGMLFLALTAAYLGWHWREVSAWAGGMR